MDLTEDDIAVLRYIHRYRFIRADDLYRLFPGRTPDRLSRRLTLLYRAHYLDRPPAQIDRFRTGGSQSLVYGLDAAGARLLKEKFAVAIGSTDWKSRNRTYTRENLDHTLEVARFMIDLDVACRAHANITCLHGDEIIGRDMEGALRGLTKWPVPIRAGSGTTDVHLAPDAIFGIRVHQPDRDSLVSYVCLEIDRGTMTIQPAEHIEESEAFLYRATVLRKLYAYAESWRRKLHLTYLRVPTPRVLFVTHSESRSEAIRQVAYEKVVQPHKLPRGLFLFGTGSTASNPLLPVWKTAAGETQSLLPFSPT